MSVNARADRCGRAGGAARGRRPETLPGRAASDCCGAAKSDCVVQQKLSENAKNMLSRRPPAGADKKTSSSGFVPVDRVGGGEYIKPPSGCRA
jgi:hypothetical protein